MEETGRADRFEQNGQEKEVLNNQQKEQVQEEKEQQQEDEDEDGDQEQQQHKEHILSSDKLVSDSASSKTENENLGVPAKKLTKKKDKEIVEQETSRPSILEPFISQLEKAGEYIMHFDLAKPTTVASNGIRPMLVIIDACNNQVTTFSKDSVFNCHATFKDGVISYRITFRYFANSVSLNMKTDGSVDLNRVIDNCVSIQSDSFLTIIMNSGVT